MPDENAVTLTWVVASARVGEPVEFSEVPVRNAIPGPGGYSVEIRRGRKWQGALVTPSRLGKPDASIYQGKVEGGLWVLGEDAEGAKAQLAEAMRACLEWEAQRVRASLDSLPEAPAPQPGPRR